MSRFTQVDRLSIILSKTQQKEVLSIDDLAQTLSVTERTIRNDVAALNHELRDIAEFQHNKGEYHLHIYKESDYKKIVNTFVNDQKQMDTPEQRAKLLIAELLNTSQSIKMDDLSSKLNVSRSTLVNDLIRLRVTLEPYNLVIKGKPNNGIQILGTEWHKRLYILQNNEHNLSYSLEEAVDSLVHQFAMNHQLAETTEHKLIQYVAVILHRANNFPLSYSEFDQTYITSTKEYQMVGPLMKKLERQSGLSFSEAERAFITVPILGRRSPVNIPDLTSVPLPDSVTQLIKDIEEQVKKELNIEIDFKQMTQELGYHLMFMLNRLVFGVKIHNSLMSEVRDKYPLACEIADIAYEVIRHRYRIDVTDSELSYLAYYFGVAITENQEQAKMLKRVAIVCDTGRGSARLIAMQLDKILPDHVEKKLLSSLVVTKQLLEDFDMVFSTVPLPTDVSTPIIEVKDIFDERELARRINKRFALETLQMSGDKKNDCIISQLLSDDKFFILNTQKTYTENLLTMINHLEKKKDVDEQFKTRLMEREKTRQTLFDQGIAFPHAINLENPDIVLSIGIFPAKKKVGNSDIRLVFLLGIPESHHNETLLVNLYDEMIALANNQTWLDHISESTSCSEARTLIRNCLLNH